MPATTRAYVKTSIACLALGALLGAIMMIGRWLPLGAVSDYLRTPHVHLLIVGWLTQLILGVAWWLFPPLAGAAARRGQARRGSEPLFWATYGLLNAAVLLRALADPLYTLTGGPLFRFLIALSALCLAATAVTFVINLWPRVRELAGHR
jgi:hypothetical protein